MQSLDGCTVASAAGDETLKFWNVFGVPEAKKPFSSQRADLFLHNHGNYVIELGANMTKKAATNHLIRLQNYMKMFSAFSGILVNFTTKERQAKFFPGLDESDFEEESDEEETFDWDEADLDQSIKITPLIGI